MLILKLMEQKHFYDKKPTSEISRLSQPQLYALYLGRHYKLRRSSIGWWVEDHLRWGVTEPVRIISPATIKSLWRMGVLDGTPDAKILDQTGLVTSQPELWTNDRGKDLLDQIRRDTGIFYDYESDQLIMPFDCDHGTDYPSVAIH